MEKDIKWSEEHKGGKYVALADPIVQTTFDFLTDPNCSDSAFLWHVGLSVVVVLYMLRLALYSMDGPNQYDGRNDMATEDWLPTSDGYWYWEIVLCIPLIFDGCMRVVVVYYLYNGEGNKRLLRIFNKSTFEQTLMLVEIASIVPLFVRVFVFFPLRASLSLEESVVAFRFTFRMFELLVFSRLIRSTKDIIAIRAIRVVFANSSQHLLVPLWFFAAFNTVAAILFYFMEPCYNETICPWQTLFESAWFSVVTMSTVGYGDMVPYYEHARALAVLVMFFGALFTAMPLAIIGNEYESTWEQMNVIKRSEDQKKAKMKLAKELSEIDSKVTKAMQDSAIQMHTILNEGTQAASLNKTRATIMMSNNPQNGGDASISQNSSLDKSYSPLPAVVDGLKNNIAKLRIQTVIHSDEADPKTKESLAHILAPRYLSPRILDNLIQLREWITAIRVSLRDLEKIGEAGLLSLSYLEDLEETFIITEKLAFELLSGDNELMTEAERNRKREAKRKAKAQKKKEKEERRAKRRLKATIESAQHKQDAELLDYQKTLNRVRALEKDQMTQAHSHSALLGRRHRVLPSVTNEFLDWIRDTSDYLWANLFVTGTNRVTPSEDKKYAENLQKHQHENPDGSGPVSNHKIHKHSFVQRYFHVRKVQARENPDAFDNRLLNFLIFPKTSKAKAFLVVLMGVVLMGIVLLFSESATSWTTYGEGTDICRDAVQVYCTDKAVDTDPACFVQATDGSGVLNPATPLKYGCKTDECYGYGANFGAEDSLMSCKYRSDSAAFEDDYTDQRVFSSNYDLLQRYGIPTFLKSRTEMNLQSDICSRVECRLGGDASWDASAFFWFGEVFTNMFFMGEMLLRIYAVGSVVVYFLCSIYHCFDVLALMPFFIEIFRQYREVGSITTTDFSILASTPRPISFLIMRSLKIMRLFRIMIQFSSSATLIETGTKSYMEILLVLAILFALVTLFSLAFYEIESGNSCYVSTEAGDGINGNTYCGYDPEAGEVTFYGRRLGDRVVISKDGLYSQFRDVFHCMWYCFVTITTVGYGDMFPSTNNGRILAVVMMLSGSLYMSIPLTAIGGIFYEAHLNNNKDAMAKVKKEGLKLSIASLRKQDNAGESMDTVDTLVHVRAAKHLESLFTELHRRVSTIIEELRLPQAEPQVLDLQMFKNLVEDGGRVNRKRAKKPPISKYLIATGMCAGEGVELGIKTLDVLTDMTNFSRDQNFTLFSVVELMDSGE